MEILIRNYWLHFLKIKINNRVRKKLIDKKYLLVGESFYDKNKIYQSTLTIDGNLLYNGIISSIHKTSATILNLTNNNGWDYWFVERNGDLLSIDEMK